jgi:hypothetical protein
MLFKVSRSDPWYANIVNFIVVGYVPPGRIKENSSIKVVSTYGMSRTSSDYALMAYS